MRNSFIIFLRVLQKFTGFPPGACQEKKPSPHLWPLFCLFLAGLALGACQEKKAPPQRRTPSLFHPSIQRDLARVPPRQAQRQPAPSAPSTVPSSTAKARVAGMQWSVPAGWVALERRPMRVATYQLPQSQGKTSPAQCAVYYFGPNRGGTIKANLKRWKGQFSSLSTQPLIHKRPAQPGKKPPFSLVTIDLRGTYLAAARPMSSQKTARPRYRMFGAIVQAPRGRVFFKCTGPQKTMAQAFPAFRSLLQSLKKTP